MEQEILVFFAGHMDALPIFTRLEAALRAQIPELTMKMQKTQITFSCHRGFGFVSFLPVRPKPLRPPVWLTVSFGLNRPVNHPRIAAATEPYPGRWTHHVLISGPDEIDGTLLSWLMEAAKFSRQKR